MSFTGEWTLPLFESEGTFEKSFGEFRGAWPMPFWDISGTIVPDNGYVGDWRLPFFEFKGDLKVGGAYTGNWVLPFWQMQGAFGSPYFNGVWRFPFWVMSGRLPLPPVFPEFRGWPLNTKHSALTEYTNFPMNSFARFADEYLGAGPAGLYGLDGADDAGIMIDARVRFALSDMGIPELKRMEDAFLSYRSDGRLTFRIVVDGGLTYEYPLEPTGKSGIYTARVKTGKGLQLTYLCFEIANMEGEAFDLDAIRVRPVVLSRLV